MDVSVYREAIVAIFDYPYGTGGENIRIKYVSPSIVRRIDRKCTVYRGHQPVTDEYIRDEMLILEAVDGWEGFTYGDKDFPCTEENVKFMIANDYDFPRFVVGKCTDVQALKAQKDAEDEKKSVLTSGQEPTSQG